MLVSRIANLNAQKLVDGERKGQEEKKRGKTKKKKTLMDLTYMKKKHVKALTRLKPIKPQTPWPFWRRGNGASEVCGVRCRKDWCRGMLQPCGHVCVQRVWQGSLGLKQCPLCRQVVNASLLAFFSCLLLYDA